MAGGYELTYQRLSDLEFPRERMSAAMKFLRTARLGAHQFQLVLFEDAPPQVIPFFGIESDEPTAGIRQFSAQYSGEPHLFDMVRSVFLDAEHMKAFVRRSLGPLDHRGHQMEHPVRYAVKLAYPCTAEIAMSGRSQGQGKKHQQDFSDWLRQCFSERYGLLMEDRSKELRCAAQRRMDSDNFKAEAVATLEELAVTNLAEKLRHYAKIPNVIERAAKVFVVMDVMES